MSCSGLARLVTIHSQFPSSTTVPPLPPLLDSRHPSHVTRSDLQSGPAVRGPVQSWPFLGSGHLRATPNTPRSAYDGRQAFRGEFRRVKVSFGISAASLRGHRHTSIHSERRTHRHPGKPKIHTPFAAICLQHQTPI